MTGKGEEPSDHPGSGGFVGQILEIRWSHGVGDRIGHDQQNRHQEKPEDKTE